MALLRGAGYRRTRLLGKTTEGNLSSKRSGLTGEKDLEGTRKEARPKRKAEGPECKAEREAGEETGPEQEAEGEEGTKQKDFILPRASKIARW